MKAVQSITKEEKNLPMKTIELKFNKRLSETKLMDRLDFKKPFKVMVDAPTGGGKTYYVIDYLKKNNIPFVFLADTLLLMKQIAKTYELDTFSADNHAGVTSKQVVSVYNHISTFCKGKVVVIDEAHSLVADYRYKKDVVSDLLAYGDIAEQVIMLSGTPLYSEDEFYNNVEVFKCKRNTPKQYNIQLLNCKGDKVTENIIETAISMRERGITPVVSMLNTGDKVNALCNLLKENGFNTIGLINSIAKNGEMDVDSSHYEELVEKSTISADIIITTYVQGYNINNKNCGLILVPSNNRHSYVSIAQMVARFREIEDLEIHLVGSMSDSKTFPSFQEMRKVLYNNKKSEVTTLIGDITSKARTSRAAVKLLELECENRSLINFSMTLDYQMMANRLLSDVSNVLYSNIKSANQILGQFNITITERETMEDITCVMETQNKDKELDYSKLVEEYFESKEYGIKTNNMYKVHECYLTLKDYGLSDTTIKANLMEVYGNKKEFNRLVQGYSLRLSTDKSIIHIRKEIYSSFTTNEWYSNDDIYDIVSQVVIENGGKCKSKSKASEIFNCLFDASLTRRRNDEKLLRGYTVNSIKIK